jgi:hypothetical protein
VAAVFRTLRCGRLDLAVTLSCCLACLELSQRRERKQSSRTFRRPSLLSLLLTALTSYTLPHNQLTAHAHAHTHRKYERERGLQPDRLSLLRIRHTHVIDHCSLLSLVLANERHTAGDRVRSGSPFVAGDRALPRCETHPTGTSLLLHQRMSALRCA